MRAHFYALFISLSIPFLTFGQQEPDILPFSIRLGLSDEGIPTVNAGPFDAEAALEDDQRRDAEGVLPLYGRMVSVGASLENSGIWTTLPNGDRIWRLRIVSEGALATDLFFENFHLPP